MEDTELIAGCLRGNIEDFREIVERYSALTMALALNILGNRDDAEDVCQEAFIQVYRNLDRFDTGRSFKNWLTTILYRRCLDHLKRRRRSLELLKKMKTLSLEKQAFEPNNPPQEKSLPSRLLEHLTAKERISLCLWANEGFTPGSGLPAQDQAERFRINYLRVENKPVQAYLYRPGESDLIIVWVQKPT